MDAFYAIRVTCHPEPKTEEKIGFPTKEAAQIYLDDAAKPGEQWIIVRSKDGIFVHVKGIIYGL